MITKEMVRPFSPCLIVAKDNRDDPTIVERWRDVVYVVRVECGYLTDDFEFPVPWPFGEKGRLRTYLQEAP